MKLKIVVNRESIEPLFGNRGGIDRDMGFAVAQEILRPVPPGAGIWNVSSDGFDYRPGVSRLDAASSGESVVVESIRSQDSRLWWIDGEASAAVRSAAEASANACILRWQKHCGRYGAGSASIHPLDVGFDPALTS